MLDPEKVTGVKRLLAEGGLPLRKIAEVVGMSRGSVAAIATGRRPDYEGKLREQSLRAEAEEVLGTSSPKRCPDCGGLACLPCRACHLRQTRRIIPTPPKPDATCGLELQSDDRERYEEIRQMRLAVGSAGEPVTILA